MSTATTILATIGRTGTKARRTIRHSPDFPGPDADTREGRPATRIPTGGLLTG